MAGGARAAARPNSTPLTGETWEEWQIPRELPAVRRPEAAARAPREVVGSASPASARSTPASPRAPTWNILYDKPYTDPARVRVAGPFTVESLSPHRVLPASEDDLIEALDAADGKRSAADADLAGADFAGIVIDYLKTEGVKQQAKGDRITFESIAPWPGNFIGAAATFIEGGSIGRSWGPRAPRRDPDRPRIRHRRAGRTWSPPRARRWTTASTC